MSARDYTCTPVVVLEGATATQVEVDASPGKSFINEKDGNMKEVISHMWDQLLVKIR